MASKTYKKIPAPENKHNKKVITLIRVTFVFVASAMPAQTPKILPFFFDLYNFFKVITP